MCSKVFPVNLLLAFRPLKQDYPLEVWRTRAEMHSVRVDHQTTITGSSARIDLTAEVADSLMHKGTIAELSPNLLSLLQQRFQHQPFGSLGRGRDPKFLGNLPVPIFMIPVFPIRQDFVAEGRILRPG
jgi:hypothetical protein